MVRIYVRDYEDGGYKEIKEYADHHNESARRLKAASDPEGASGFMGTNLGAVMSLASLSPYFAGAKSLFSELSTATMTSSTNSMEHAQQQEVTATNIDLAMRSYWSDDRANAAVTHANRTAIGQYEKALGSVRTFNEHTRQANADNKETQRTMDETARVANERIREFNERNPDNDAEAAQMASRGSASGGGAGGGAGAGNGGGSHGAENGGQAAGGQP